MAAPISFDFERTVTSSHQTGNIELSTGKLELNEYLFERSTTSSPTPTPYSITQVLVLVNCMTVSCHVFAPFVACSRCVVYILTTGLVLVHHPVNSADYSIIFKYIIY